MQRAKIIVKNNSQKIERSYFVKRPGHLVTQASCKKWPMLVQGCGQVSVSAGIAKNMLIQTSFN